MTEKLLALKTVSADMTAYNKFQWPTSGIVEAPDWEPTEECGKGLHALAWGNGDGDLLDWSHQAKWLVVEVDVEAGVVDLQGKIKFKRCEVIHCGDRVSATQYLFNHGGAGKKIVGLSLLCGNESTLTGGDGSTLTGGDGSILTGGDYSILTSGDDSTLTGGKCSTLTGGYQSTLTGGNYSTLTGGKCSTLTGGYQSTLTGGNYSTLTGGYWSILTGGYGSTLTGGNESTLTGGYGSTLTGGYGSTLTGGYGSTLIIKRFDGTHTRVYTAYVGENGIQPGVAYTVNESGEWAEVRSLNKQ